MKTVNKESQFPTRRVISYELSNVVWAYGFNVYGWGFIIPLGSKIDSITNITVLDYFNNNDGLWYPLTYGSDIVSLEAKAIQCAPVTSVPAGAAILVRIKGTVNLKFVE